MRRLTKEINNKRKQIERLKAVDIGMAAIHGRKFNEGKIKAAQAFIIKAKQAEKRADYY